MLFRIYFIDHSKIPDPKSKDIISTFHFLDIAAWSSIDGIVRQFFDMTDEVLSELTSLGSHYDLGLLCESVRVS
jgi:hypothetical protein